MGLLGEEVTLGFIAVGFGFVDGLDDLEGEDGSVNGLELAFFVVFAVPYKLGHFDSSFGRKASVVATESPAQGMGPSATGLVMACERVFSDRQL